MSSEQPPENPENAGNPSTEPAPPAASPPDPGHPPVQPSAPQKKRTGLIVGTTVGAVVAVAVAVSVIVVTGKSSSPASSAAAAASKPAADPSPATTFTGAQRSGIASSSAALGTPASGSGPAAAEVAVPASAGGLTQMTDSVGLQRAAAMKKADASVPDLADADFAAYSKNGSSAYFGNLTLVQLNEATDLEGSYLADGAAATLTAAGADTAVADPDHVEVTMPAGAMTCGMVSTGSVTLRSCFWVDASEFGILAVPSSTSNDQAAAYAEAVWSASETS